MNLSKPLIKSGFNRAADNYEQYADLQRKVSEKLSKYAWGLFDPKGLILDVGSGTGFNKQILKSSNMIQLDISENMCKKSVLLGPTINADMEDLPISLNSMDGIISSLSLQWATDTKQVFKEFYKVLKPGSSFALSTFGVHTLQELKSVFRTMDPFAHVNQFLDPSTLASKAKIVGFEDIEIQSDIEVKEYSDVMQLMNVMKRIGASNKQLDRKKSLIGRQYFKKLDEIYKSNFGRIGNIPATWEVIYMKGTKK